MDEFRRNNTRNFQAREQTSFGCTHTRIYNIYIYRYQLHGAYCIRRLKGHWSVTTYLIYNICILYYATILYEVVCVHCTCSTRHGQKTRPQRDLRTICKIKRFEYNNIYYVVESLHLYNLLCRGHCTYRYGHIRIVIKHCNIMCNAYGRISYRRVCMATNPLFFNVCRSLAHCASTL